MISIPSAKSSRGRAVSRVAFTLIELLVVIAIIAVLAGLLLPSLMNARKTARVAASQMNLRSMSQINAAFCTDHRGEFFNPFVRGQIDPSGDKDSQGPHGSYGSGKPRFATESFMAYWYSELKNIDPNNGMPIEASISPADGDLLAATRSAGTGAGVAATSYYYSPTMWRSPGVFSGSQGCCSNEYGTLYRQECCDGECHPIDMCASTARLSLDQVSFPSAKVMLFERGDFFQKTRSVIGGTGAGNQKLPPAWNNPRARPSVVTVDGAVTQADMQSLTALAVKGVTDDAYTELLPTDLINVPNLMGPLSLLGAGTAVIDHLPLSATDGLYPDFFGATRGGVKGRDLSR